MTTSNRRETASCSGRVLVVDDHPQARQSMADILRQAGHRVECCSSGAEALQLVEHDPPDCIVTDLKMPRLDGMGLLDHVIHEDPSIPVIIITAYGTMETAEEAIQKGAYDFITKPFNAPDLINSVNKSLERQKHNLRLKNFVRYNTLVKRY